MGFLWKRMFVGGALLAVDCVFAADSVSFSSVTLAPPTAEEVSASVLNDGNSFRLESVFGKAARGERIVLSALGGSITAGAGAGGTNGRWSDLVADWFARTFPSRPVFTDAYDHGALTLPSALKIVENVGFRKGCDRECWHDVLAGFRPGDRLSFSTDATTLTLLFWQRRADFGRVRVSVDGKEETVLDGWFEAVWGGRARPVEIFRNRPGHHVVDIEIIGERSPESKGNRFELCAVLEQRENAHTSTITVEKPYFRWLFGGFGFQHSEASLTAMMSDESRVGRHDGKFSVVSVDR